MSDDRKPTDVANVNRYGISVWIATGLGVGFVPIAGSTLGTALGLPLAWGIDRIGHVFGEALAVALVCCVGAKIIDAALAQLGRGKDPRCVVLDELVSVPIAFFGLPMASLTFVVLGFVVLRVIDIAKPPPLHRLERLPGGWGVMADDWMAGVYTNLILRGMLAFAPATWFAS